MAKRFVNPFAVSGDRLQVLDDEQPDGLVSYESGYTPRYSLDITDPSSTARRVNRDRFNQILFDITDNLKEWQEQLFPAYITPAANGGVAVPYRKGMIVTYNGESRISLVDNNTTQPNDNSNWADAFPLPVALGGTGQTTNITVPVGAVFSWPLNTPPAGYLEMRGQAIDPGTYPILTSIYGSSLLDYRGEFIRGWDNGRGIDTDRVLLSAQADELKAHSHNFDLVDLDQSAVNLSQGGEGANNQMRTGGSARSGQFKILDTGGAETRPRNVAMMWIVRAG